MTFTRDFPASQFLTLWSSVQRFINSKEIHPQYRFPNLFYGGIVCRWMLQTWKFSLTWNLNVPRSSYAWTFENQLGTVCGYYGAFEMQISVEEMSSCKAGFEDWYSPAPSHRYVSTYKCSFSYKALNIHVLSATIDCILLNCEPN